MITSRSTYLAILSPVVLTTVLVSAICFVGGMLIWQRFGPMLAVVLLGLLALLALVSLRMLFANVIAVKPGHAVIMEDINTHQWTALLSGFHFCPPGLYRVLGRTANFAVEKERTMHNVTVQGGPALSIKVTYTAQVATPPGVLRLPRKGMEALDLKYVIGLYLLTLGDVWDQKHAVALEESLRRYFGNCAQAQVFALLGNVSTSPEKLYKELNQHLTGTVKQERGIALQICALEVLGLDKERAMIWRNQLLAHLMDDLKRLSPQQATAIAEIFREVAGGGPHVHINPNARP